MQQLTIWNPRVVSLVCFYHYNFFLSLSYISPNVLLCAGPRGKKWQNLQIKGKGKADVLQVFSPHTQHPMAVEENMVCKIIKRKL